MLSYSFKHAQRFTSHWELLHIDNSAYLFPMCLLATDNEAIAETVSASSTSCRRASLNEQPSVEAERCRERQYLPTKDQDRVKVTYM